MYDPLANIFSGDILRRTSFTVFGTELHASSPLEVYMSVAIIYSIQEERTSWINVIEANAPNCSVRGKPSCA